MGLSTSTKASRLGRTQRDIEAEGIAADKLQFEEERLPWQSGSVYAVSALGYRLQRNLTLTLNPQR